MKKSTNLRKIVSAAIHPSIGFARVGNSPDSYFLASEVPYPRPKPQGFYRDDEGRIKRQAVKFRIYGYDKDGRPVAELTLKNSEIEWGVHVANKKGSWYIFNYAMDIPQAVPVKLRNKNISEADRHQLVIDPGERKISGRYKKGKAEYIFDTGTFMDKKVYLGELRTDGEGRVVFLGGHGVAESIYSGNFVAGVGNQDGWYDDISDGPVRASVKIDGIEIPVKPAWVVASPVDFAPDFKDIVTLYDCIFDASIQGSLIDFPSQISFINDIHPIFHRLSSYSWLNEGYNNAFGYHAPFNFESDRLINRLSRTDDLFQETRRQIFRRFRDPSSTDPLWDKWPWNYGDGIQAPPKITANQYFSITPTQYKMLQMWVDGNFVNDWDQRSSMYKNRLGDFPIDEQPRILDRTSLDSALGGPFRPGVELTWPMRQITMYSDPFRVRVRDNNNPDPDYGAVLTPTEALTLGGPLYYNSPGDLTRWMSVPWQLDLAACRYAYFGEDPYLPTFWAARAPNQVLTENNYLMVMDKSLPMEERLKAFFQRENWYRFLHGGTFTQMNEMITEYVNQAFIEKRQGPQKEPNFPKEMYVEEKIESKELVDLQVKGERHFDYLKIIEYYNASG